MTEQNKLNISYQNLTLDELIDEAIRNNDALALEIIYRFETKIQWNEEDDCKPMSMININASRYNQ